MNDTTIPRPIRDADAAINEVRAVIAALNEGRLHFQGKIVKDETGTYCLDLRPIIDQQSKSMKVTIKDPDVLSSIRPCVLANYLLSKSWENEYKYDTKQFARWIKHRGTVVECEVTVPLDISYVDYAARMSDVLKVLELDEGRSQLDILYDIMG